jgi:serralysin
LTAIHEIGHAVGLGHPFTSPGDTGPQLPTATNNHLFTQMSYTRAWQVPGVRNEQAPDGNGYGIDTPMLYDIMEIQRLYGATVEQNGGNTVHRWSNQPFRETVRDTDGFDTLDASNFSTDQYIDLRPGRMSNIGENSHSVLITHDTRIENAIGGRGNDRLVGNELNNLLVGGLGNDILEGRGGTNILMGGAGNDSYIWRMGDAWSTIDEDRGAGRDEIHIYGNHSTQNAPFGTINDLTDDFIFRRIGRDLRIDFTINNGEAAGGLTITNMAWGGSRVETLRMFGVNGQQLGNAVNLESIFLQATDVGQRFRLTETEHPFGNIAVPV